MPGFPFVTKKHDGLEPGGPLDYTKSAGYSSLDVENVREAITATPAIGNLDGDAKPEIVVSTYQGTIYAVKSDGRVLAGWPVRLDDVPSCPLAEGVPRAALCMDPVHLIARGAFASPVLSDMNGDGKLDVIQAAFDGQVHVFGADGKPLEGWPVRIRYPGPQSQELGRILTTPAVADFNGDGTPDMLVGSNEKIGSGDGFGAFYLVDGRGMKAGDPPFLPGWPITMVSFKLFPLVAEGVGNSPVAADFDADGRPEAVMHGNGSAPLILPAEPGTQNTQGGTPSRALPERIDERGDPARGLEPTTNFGAESRARLGDIMFPLFAQPAAGDLDQDGVPDVTSSGASLSVARNLLTSQPRGDPGQFLLSMWSGRTGKMFPGSPVPLEDFTFFNNQAIADLTGDGLPEVLTGSGGYYVHAADACGREPSGWPKFTGQWIIATAAVGDIDGDSDGTLEVVVGTRSGWLYAWHTKGKKDGVIEWESFHHDNQNTGVLARERVVAPKPLEISPDGRCVVPITEGGPPGMAEPEITPTGGCSCRAAPKNERAWALAALLPALVLAGRHRRSARSGRSVCGAQRSLRWL